MVRNNLAYRDNAQTFTVNGYDSNYHRQVVDATFEGNTVVNNGTQGNFLNTTGPASGLVLVDNLFVAPNLKVGLAGAVPVFVEESTLASFSRIAHNVWPLGNPDPHARGGVNYVWPYWFSYGAYQSPAQWNVLLGVDSDVFVNAAVDSTGALVTPASLLGAGVPMSGLLWDFYGHPRTGPVTAGAVLPSVSSS